MTTGNGANPPNVSCVVCGVWWDLWHTHPWPLWPFQRICRAPVVHVMIRFCNHVTTTLHPLVAETPTCQTSLSHTHSQQHGPDAAVGLAGNLGVCNDLLLLPFAAQGLWVVRNFSVGNMSLVPEFLCALPAGSAQFGDIAMMHSGDLVVRVTDACSV